MFFVGLGHSHVVALARGAYALQARGAQFAGEPFSSKFHYLYDAPYEPPFLETEEGRRLNPSIADALSDGDPLFVLTSVGGNEHNVVSIAQRGPRFDFILGEQPELPLDARSEIIPEAAIRETLRDWMEPKVEVLRAISATTARLVVQIEPPPPLPREQVLAYPKEFFRTVFDQRRMSSDTLRYKMWRVQTALLREACESIGAHYVDTPADMMDDDGMLMLSFCGKDATHANEAYGEAMIERALQLVARQTALAG
ncbi:MAG: hypothetical protein KGM42_12405 [Hyphomicrobiales bacterium]|nr:hypothetical protein [Hyphomicrobiales bacterium]